MIILADEPTGALDTKTTADIMGIFQRMNDKGKTVIIVTHEPEIAAYAKRNIHFRDGQIVSDDRVNNRTLAGSETGCL